MSSEHDLIYYRKRERHARAMANRAASRSVGALHEELAARYHGLAIAAEFNESIADYISDRDVAHIASSNA